MRIAEQTVSYRIIEDKSQSLQPLNQPRDLITTKPTAPPVALEQNNSSSDQPEQGDNRRDRFDDYDVRDISPRQMVELSQELYYSGLINFDDYAALAYQPELQPDYNQTIGALTGEPAEPDRQRDFVQYWEDRAAFELKYNTADSKDVAVSSRIVDILRSLGSPATDIVV